MVEKVKITGSTLQPCSLDLVQGGRTYGAYSSLFYGQMIDLVSGDVTTSGQDISTRLLGDTLLALGDVEMNSLLGDPIWALMSS